jgi:hypothetical protein
MNAMQHQQQPAVSMRRVAFHVLTCWTHWQHSCRMELCSSAALLQASAVEQTVSDARCFLDSSRLACPQHRALSSYLCALLPEGALLLSALSLALTADASQSDVERMPLLPSCQLHRTIHDPLHLMLLLSLMSYRTAH